MQAEDRAGTPSLGSLWAGRIFSTLAVLFLLFDAVIKFIKIPPVAEAFARLGYPPSLAVPIGSILLGCVILYIIPQTSVLGAVLLTGYLGGAVATHVRVGDPLFSHILFPTYVGLMIWGGLYVREPRLRALIPFRNPQRTP